MAEHLTRIVPICIAAGILSLVLSTTTTSVGAQTDPTRPPDAPAARQAAGGARADSQLKSILISNGRTEALIGDKIVRVGEKVGNAQVVRISESEVVLRNENGLQTMKLFPGIEKRVIVASGDRAVDAKRDSREKSKK